MKRILFALLFVFVLPLAALAQDDVVKIPVADVSDGQAHFYKLNVDGVSVKYFLVKAPDGTIRSALDACEACFPEKKGYKQAGEVMVCVNCGQKFHVSRVGMVKGGCNPHPLKSAVVDGQVVISKADLAEGVKYFK